MKRLVSFCPHIWTKVDSVHQVLVSSCFSFFLSLPISFFSWYYWSSDACTSSTYLLTPPIRAVHLELHNLNRSAPSLSAQVRVAAGRGVCQIERVYVSIITCDVTMIHAFMITEMH